MKKTNFVCGICGDTIAGLDEYVAHVKECSVCKVEQEQKKLEELNAAINKVRMAKSYYEECLLEFKEKYPKEYELNFGTSQTSTPKAQGNVFTRDLDRDDFVDLMKTIFELC